MDFVSASSFLSQTDSILEPGVSSALKSFLQNAPSSLSMPDRVKQIQDKVVQNYKGYGPMCNVMMDLIRSMPNAKPDEMVHKAMADLFRSNFSEAKLLQQAEPVWIKDLVKLDSVWQSVFASITSPFLSSYLKPILTRSTSQDMSTMNFERFTIKFESNIEAFCRGKIDLETAVSNSSNVFNVGTKEASYLLSTYYLHALSQADTFYLDALNRELVDKTLLRYHAIVMRDSSDISSDLLESILSDSIFARYSESFVDRTEKLPTKFCRSIVFDALFNYLFERWNLDFDMGHIVSDCVTMRIANIIATAIDQRKEVVISAIEHVAIYHAMIRDQTITVTNCLSDDLLQTPAVAMILVTGWTKICHTSTLHCNPVLLITLSKIIEYHPLLGEKIYSLMIKAAEISPNIISLFPFFIYAGHLWALDQISKHNDYFAQVLVDLLGCIDPPFSPFFISTIASIFDLSSCVSSFKLLLGKPKQGGGIYTKELIRDVLLRNKIDEWKSFIIKILQKL